MGPLKMHRSGRILYGKRNLKLNTDYDRNGYAEKIRPA